MKLPQFWLSSLLLLSCRLQVSLAQQTGVVRFETGKFCPSTTQRSALARRLSGVFATNACAVECAASSNCSALHRIGTECYLASRPDWQDTWENSVGCQGNGAATLVRLPTAPAELTASLVVWLSLRASLNNLVNSSASPAQLIGPAALRNASGVVLPSGSGDSYLQLPPPDDSGLEARRGPLGQFALFIKAEWQSKPDGNSTYLFRATSASNTVVFWAYEESRRIKFGNRKAVTVNYATGTVLPIAKSVNSFGISFNGSDYSAYLNGKSEPVSQYSTIAATTAVSSIVLLGAKQGELVDGAMKGRLLCLGYWARAVTLEQFAEFDGLC